MKALLAILLLGSIILSGCSQKPQVKEFVMESYTEIIDEKYYPKFSPNEITVNKGDTVRIKITNTKGTHDFKIDEFAVATSQINGGEKATVAFTADKAGSFEYYCSVGNHRTMGMKGTLTVTE